MNRSVLMTGAQYFTDADPINDLMDNVVNVDVGKAIAEHARIVQAFQQAGIQVTKIPAPPGCQDGVYTSNWGLVRGKKVLMSRLPNKRQPEEPHALEAVKQLGLEPLILPNDVERFSGQADALPCGDIVFTQSPFRTTTAAHRYLSEWLGYREVIALETKPARHFRFGPAKINKLTGWPDSPTYDIDLAISILKRPTASQKGLIAYCPAVFKRASRARLRAYGGVDKIEVAHDEAAKVFAMNLVSTGETVIMPAGAPKFQAAMEAHGLRVVTLDLPELRKGGGSIRCSSLTLDNN